MDEYRRQEATASVSEFTRKEPEHEGRRCRYRIYLQVDQPEQKGNDDRGIGKRTTEQTKALPEIAEPGWSAGGRERLFPPELRHRRRSKETSSTGEMTLRVEANLSSGD